MVTPELENYIKQLLSQGVSEQEIKNALHSAGWQESDINEGFNKIKPSSSQFSPLSPQPGIKISNVKESQTIIREPKRIGKIILISSIIIVLAIGGYFSYKYFKSQKQPSNEEVTPTSSSTSTLTGVGTTTSTSTLGENQLFASTTPKETYVKIKQKFDNAKTFDDLLSLAEEYGSKNQLVGIEKQKQQIDLMPASLRDGIVATLKSGVPQLGEITEITETINGNNAVLNLTSLKANGIVKMVFEDNQWKLDSEEWKSKN